KGADAARFSAECRQGEAMQQIKMRPMWRSRLNIPDKRDTGQHVAGPIAEVATAIDHGERKPIIVPENDEHRLRHQPVESARNVSQRFAGVWQAVGTTVKIQGKEDVGLDDFAVPPEYERSFQLQAEFVSCRSEFGLRYLKKEVD